jgi:hypothetical protein
MSTTFLQSDLEDAQAKQAYKVWAASSHLLQHYLSPAEMLVGCAGW